MSKNDDFESAFIISNAVKNDKDYLEEANLTSQDQTDNVSYALLLLRDQ